MNYLSHTKEEILRALKEGQEVFEFINNDDSDLNDVLIGTEEECETDLCNYYEVEKFQSHWRLRKVDFEEFFTMMGIEEVSDVDEMVRYIKTHYENPDCSTVRGHCEAAWSYGHEISEDDVMIELGLGE